MNSWFPIEDIPILDASNLQKTLSLNIACIRKFDLESNAILLIHSNLKKDKMCILNAWLIYLT